MPVLQHALVYLLELFYEERVRLILLSLGILGFQVVVCQ